jgi:hypothetical protein
VAGLIVAVSSHNRSAAANRRPALQSDGSDNLSATVAADRAFPAAVAELGRYAHVNNSEREYIGEVLFIVGGKRRQLAPLSVIGKAIEDGRCSRDNRTTATSSCCLAKWERRHSLTMFAYVTPNHLHQLNKAWHRSPADLRLLIRSTAKDR